MPNASLYRLTIVAAALAGAAAACTPARSGPPPGTGPLPLPTSDAAPLRAAWAIRPREHVDLWLHGLAMIMDDSARVPLFRRGYRDEMRAARTRANVTTRLDAERDRLRARFAANPQLPLDAQFVPFLFDSWESIHRAADLLQQTNGNPQRAGDQETARSIAMLTSIFRTPADREWLRVFVGALDDESTRFYHGYWTATQQQRTASLAGINAAWEALRPRIERFLVNSQQRGGVLVPSLPLGGEGRTQTNGATSGIIAVSFPPNAETAVEAIYTAVHEFVGATVGPVVADNVSPADQRAGLADRYVGAAQVRGGLMLLQKTAPDHAAGYARYYLGLIGSHATGDPIAALADAFPLPPGILDAVGKQIDAVIAGI